MSATFELFEDTAGKYRLRLVHTNGNIIADGGEGYATKQKAKQGIQSVKDNAPDAGVVEVDD
ncbi:HVO_2922 family protein [Halobellus sp. GM3]|uniref:HVO_2922 family protein n=1 Tax=Halobellus sp. GM3 TaxID=3458410 RepID=UPI00403D6449